MLCVYVFLKNLLCRLPYTPRFLFSPANTHLIQTGATESVCMKKCSPLEPLDANALNRQIADNEEFQSLERYLSLSLCLSVSLSLSASLCRLLSFSLVLSLTPSHSLIHSNSLPLLWRLLSPPHTF